MSLRTNVVLAALFADATAGLFTLSASYWKASLGDFPSALHLKHVCTFDLYFSLWKLMLPL
jgi:hypothetical protein